MKTAVLVPDKSAGFIPEIHKNVHYNNSTEIHCYTKTLPASTIASTDLSKPSLVKASKLSAIFLCIPKNTLSNFPGVFILPTPHGVPSRPIKNASTIYD